MQFILDTNICIYIIKRRPVKVFERFKEAQIGDVGLSTITLAELEYGVSKSAKPKQNEEALRQFIIPL